ncbi:hypothetical protein LCM00_13090 [Bacillus infantis]|uniref:hypothetical protein n=1 Tax=Bacillus infantis TaxID=324767 RepID=UPI001CD56F55|nr:hypothetical protein [Bacillus infantis]MCA1040441.1 hypothetical protein [Bacillus infantis]
MSAGFQQSVSACNEINAISDQQLEALENIAASLSPFKDPSDELSIVIHNINAGER